MSDIQNVNPKNTVLNRILLGVVIFLGLCIAAAVVALVYGFVAGWSNHSTSRQETSGPTVLQQLPPGATIIDMKIDNGRTIVRLKTRTGEEIDIYDTTTGKLVARIGPQAK